MHDIELSNSGQQTLCHTSQIFIYFLIYIFFWGVTRFRSKEEYIVELVKAVRYRLLLMA